MTIATLGLLEAGWLRDIEQRAGVNSGWRRRVHARLIHGQHTLGDSWRAHTLAELLTEAREECEDVGGWGALARLAIHDQHTAATLDPMTRNQILDHLDHAAELAARADEQLTRAIAALSPGRESAARC